MFCRETLTEDVRESADIQVLLIALENVEVSAGILLPYRKNKVFVTVSIACSDR